MASASDSQQIEEYLKAVKDFKSKNKNIPPKEMMTKRWVEIMIHRINSAKLIVKNTGLETLHESVRETLRTYGVQSDEDSEEALILLGNKIDNSSAKKIIPIEDSYEVVHKAHVSTNHGTIYEMEAWLDEAEIVIHKMCIPAYYNLCETCNVRSGKNTKLVSGADQNNETTEILPNVPITPHSPVIETTLTSHLYFDYVITIEFMNFTTKPDMLYRFLLIYEDKRNGFIQLRPMNNNKEPDIIIEVIKLFMDFGPPQCVLVDAENEVLMYKVLLEIKKLVRQPIELALRQKTEKKLTRIVERSVMKWMRQNNCRNWGTGCHIVQWNLNNTPDKNGVKPYSRLFGYKAKFPRAHDEPVIESSDDDYNVEIDFDEAEAFVPTDSEPLKEEETLMPIDPEFVNSEIVGDPLDGVIETLHSEIDLKIENEDELLLEDDHNDTAQRPDKDD